MASCVSNIISKNCQNVMIDFQVMVEDVGDVFSWGGHNVVSPKHATTFNDFSYSVAFLYSQHATKPKSVILRSLTCTRKAKF